MNRSVQVKVVAIVVLALITAGIWSAAIAEGRNGTLRVSFLNTGSGQAIFIRAPSGRIILIDGGANASTLRPLGVQLPWYKRSIDVLVSTSPDPGEIGGMPDVVARYLPDIIMQSTVSGTAPEWYSFEKTVQQKNAAGMHVVEAKRGTIIDLGRGASIEILFPDRELSQVGMGEGSMVMRLVYGETSFILASDASDGVQQYLAALDKSALKSDVLLAASVPSPVFAGFVAPHHVVYSRNCTKNDSAPDPIFESIGTKRIDPCKEGTITLVSDGKTVTRE